MKYLRQYIRQILLTEAAKGPSDLPDNVFVQMRDRGELAEFEFVKKTGESEKYGPRYDKTVEEKDGIFGLIQLEFVDPINQ